MLKREWLLSSTVLVVSLAVSLAIGEALIRLKNSAMNNYDIEMWRYSNELKVKSADPDLDFDHRPSRNALLQHVDIRINDWGLRGEDVRPLAPEQRRVLLLGGSITLGWGVAEDKTLASLLRQKFAASGVEVQVLNAGIGNYNAARYVSRFFKELSALEPTDIVVQYFVRDAEMLPPGGGNFLLRHSQLAVTMWIAYHRLFDKQGEQSLVDHYRDVYRPDAPGFLIMQAKLRQLSEYAQHKGIRIYLAMTPDVHNLVDYKLGFVHDLMRQEALADGYVFIDLLPALRGRQPQDLWAMPGDPHPNALGHSLMADALFPALLLKDAQSQAAQMKDAKVEN
jgi:lysophospholipase L1-like esterase